MPREADPKGGVQPISTGERVNQREHLAPIVGLESKGKEEEIRPKL